jgi:5-methylcytosine-specific restriction endonuclease McrA
MRNLVKLPKPEVLAQNEDAWLDAYLADKANATKKFRYRHHDIKGQLTSETSDKCVYCESKIGHNTPGDVEHKVPSAKQEHLHFTWENLTIACTECNRRKNDFYDEYDGFLDPYIDNVEEMLEHHGPIVLWRAGEVRAEVSVKILELNSGDRIKLIERKIAKLNELATLLERHAALDAGVLKDLLKKEIDSMASVDAEYSAMVLAILGAKQAQQNVVDAPIPEEGVNPIKGSS